MNILKLKYAILIVLLSSTFFVVPLSRQSFNENLTDNLFAAIQKGDKNAVETLLNNGANPNAQEEKKSALTYAVILARDAGIVEALLKRGAYANLIDGSLMTPLEVATQYQKDPKIIQVLIEYGARITPRVNLDYTPGSIVAKEDPYDLARKELSEWEFVPTKAEIEAEAKPSSWRDTLPFIKYYLGY